MKYKLTFLDMCLSDYFAGHPNPVLQIPVWQDMTKKELMEEIVSDYNMVYDYLCSENRKNPWPNLSDSELFTMADKLILKEMPFENNDIPTSEECEKTLDDVCIFLICEEDV
ncbi:MAG: hypothetical protein DRO67_00055 [Candidatus Asgardarchaeum californiense]|nr:MAG: hypothetical protein DRO67_00055 [Candidatus Asgardarchaeum californiense]